MNRTEIVQALLTEFGVGTEWRALNEADSFTILSFVLELEKRVGFPISPSELVPSNFESVDTVLEMLERSTPKAD